MKKRVFAIFLCCFVLCFAFTAMTAGALSTRPLDVGNYNDYGGGGGGYDYGGGDYGGGDYGGGNYYFFGGGGGSSSGGGGGNFWIAAVVFIVMVAIILVGNALNKKRKGAGGTFKTFGAAPPLAENHEAQIVPAITAVDQNFSLDGFIAWSKEVFITLQNAWTARDWSQIRPFEKEELYRQHELQLQEYIRLGRINRIERINIRQAYLHKYVRDHQYEYLTVFLSVRMVDYIVDEKTGNVLKGNPNVDCYMDYLFTFMRKTGVKTQQAASTAVSKSCPHCGAPMQITSAGKCEYCGSMITTGEFDWVLAEMDAVKPGIRIDNSGVIIRQDGENKQ